MDDQAPHIAAPPTSGAADSSAAPVDGVCPGATLGDCRLDALLARHATADAYDATHLASGTPRVVYVLHAAAMQDHALVHRVVCEVDAARWLRHPAAAKVDGYGDAPGGRMYVAAERAPGRSLAERLAEGEAFTPRRVVRLACRLVEALEEAHAVGLVHGRLTPEAVVVGDDADAAGAPLVTLTGLGVAAVAHAAAVGDAERPYVAPEQQAGGAEVRGDVFGLASVLWAALAGAPPADDVGDAERADVPGADVLRAARSAEPARRHPSVRAFWEELLGALVADAAGGAARAGSAAEGSAGTTGGATGGATGSAALALGALDLTAFAFDAFDLADLELTPTSPAAPADATASPPEPRAGRPAVPAAEPAFGGADGWAEPAAAMPNPASTPGPVLTPNAAAAPAPVPGCASLGTPPGLAPAAAYEPGAPPARPRAAEPASARAYRWEGQYRAPAPATRAPARPARSWGAKQALPWWLAVPAVAAAAVGGPLARDWASPGVAPGAPSAGEVVETYAPPPVVRHRRPAGLVELPADTTAADDTLPAVPWVDVPEVVLPAPADGTRAVVRPEDFAGGLGGAPGAR